MKKTMKNSMKNIHLLILIITLIPLRLLASGQPLIERQKLVASDSSLNGAFGATIKTQDDFVFIGTYRKQAVYVNQKTNGVWSEVQKITPNPAIDGTFGFSVAVDGNIMVVGSPYYDQSSDVLEVGTAHVFEYNGTQWVQSQQLFAPGPIFRGGGQETYGKNFGYSLDIDDDTIIIGAPNLNNNAPGAAYIYKLNGTWTFSEELSASDATTRNYFGAHVKLNESRVVVAASHNIGAVYNYEFGGNNWLETQKIIPLDPPTNAFGSAMDAELNTLVVGAKFDNSVATQGGAVYTYQWDTNNGWVRTHELFAPNPTDYEKFGNTVSLSGNSLLITAQEDQAYLFKNYNNGWQSSKVLIPMEDVSQDKFGVSGAITADTIFVGSTLGDNGTNFDHGVVFTFLNDLIFVNDFEESL